MTAPAPMGSVDRSAHAMEPIDVSHGRAGFAPPPASGRTSGMPKELADTIEQLEAFAKANLGQARREQIAFWILKVPVVLASAAASLLALLHFELIAGLLAALATACGLIDAVRPRGPIRNACLRAVYQIRGLESTIIATWKAATLLWDDLNKTAAGIILDANKEAKKISDALMDVDAAMADKVK